MPTSIDITFGAEKLVLNSDRTLWWPAQKTLFATDLHAGKAEHMRRHGLAIPAGNLAQDLVRLQWAVERTKAQRLIFLGDLFHSDYNQEWETFASWCRARPYETVLVRGNHDRFLTDELLAGAGLRVEVEPYPVAPFTLRHHPVEWPLDDSYVLAGHVHPVYNLVGTGKDRLRAPCFWQQKQQLILPAFGSLTGGFVVNGLPAEHIYACAADGSAIIPAR